MADHGDSWAYTDHGVSWTCPYCGRHATITVHSRDYGSTHIELEMSEHGNHLYLHHTAVSCPNPGCNKLTLGVWLATHEGVVTLGRLETRIQRIQEWKLLPESSAKPQPDYIPAPLRTDYLEACRIVELSPKSSAAMSRRCLQGMIRDFWKTPKVQNLYQEIEAIKDKVDPLTWQAIHAVREVGNIGAHMKQDINVIVDVEPQEAELLIGLIETLFKDWYVTRHERQRQMEALVSLAKDKKAPAKAVRKAIPDAPDDAPAAPAPDAQPPAGN